MIKANKRAAIPNTIPLLEQEQNCIQKNFCSTLLIGFYLYASKRINSIRFILSKIEISDWFDTVPLSCQ